MVLILNHMLCSARVSLDLSRNLSSMTPSSLCSMLTLSPHRDVLHNRHRKKPLADPRDSRMY